MIQLRKWIFLSSIIIGITACSTDNISENSSTNESVKWNAVMGKSNSCFSRSESYSYFPDKTEFYIGVNSNVPEIDSEMNGKRTSTITVKGSEGGSQNFTSNPTVYWNDMGGRDANINIWGFYTAGQKITSYENGIVNWKIPESQTNGTSPYDLLWSNNIKNLTFKNTANMIFTHTLSKITIKLNIGEGFVQDDCNKVSVEVKNQPLTCDANIKNGSFSNIGDKKDITPYIISNFNNEMKAVYESIFVPGNSVQIGDIIATIDVGNNHYTAYSKEKRTFESGKNYIYNISVKKSGISFSSIVIEDWDNIEAEADMQIIFSANGPVNENGNGNNALNNITSKFDIYKSKNNTQFDSDSYTEGTQPSSTATWISSSGIQGTPGFIKGHWQTDTPLYWQDDSDDNYFRALSPSGEITSDNNGDFNIIGGNKDYVWGTSGNDPIHPTTGSVNIYFEHIMAKIIMTVITTDGNDKIDLSTLSTQCIENIALNRKFNIAKGEFENVNAENMGIYNFKAQKIDENKYSCEFYVCPQNLNDNAIIKLIASNAPLTNTYTKQLNKINANGSPITKWESGKRYLYTIRIKKSEMSFTAMITDWEDVLTEDTDAEL